MHLPAGARTMLLEPAGVIICQGHRSASNPVAQMCRQQGPLPQQRDQHGCRNQAYQEVCTAPLGARGLVQLQRMG